MGKRILGVLLLLIPATIFAQDKWDLRRCVDYAIKNNISVKQADVQARLSALQLQQAKMNKLPTASLGTGMGLQFGRSIDPTTNQFTTTQLLYQNYQLQGGATIYSFGRLKNGQDAASFNAQAALEDVERTKNDISLNVASYYLQVLSTKEQINISEVQLSQTRTQYENTRKRVDAGALPELNLAEIEAQLATDSSNLITAQTAFQQNLLQLKALLNIDMAAPFEVDTPPIDLIPLEPLAELEPELVFSMAVTSQPQQKANDLRIKGAEKTIKVNKAALNPSLSGFYSLGSTFNNQAISPNGSITVNPPIGKVNVDGTDYSVYPNQPYSVNTYGKTKYFKQIDQNFSQSVGINISVPIFSNGNARIAVENAKLNLENLQLQKAQADQTLKTNIYTAYTNAISSMEKYNASGRSVQSAQKAFDFATKRYEVGLLSSIDLITNQNNLLRAKLQQLANHYDYVFKMKVVEFYKGQGIKL
ncbi:TolC family protein [Limnovirga soli]|uniref:TolC family protein n=1 Tax=Limnovirga soli TaxID=2656915 RepID=A0A8J8FJ10_9BACT|nr:TolC family protein [Limnovirga soli]NNV55959.1 TolC family protein [Limnovirga soli]